MERSTEVREVKKHDPKPTSGTCCFCGFSGEEETECPDSMDETHCEHWWDGPDGDEPGTESGPPL